ncbi:MAG TPA: hypothetical protein VFT79_02755 [Solirubrobacterales bacterium]|nr:hypothetical protein [Solirubrobacterales bacterium]
MFSRFIACGVIACCLVTGSAIASADRADAKLYQGTTGMGYRIKVLVKDRAFKVKLFRVDLRCQDERQLTLTKRGFPWTKVGRRGRFGETWSRGGDSVLFRGRLDERSVWGSLRVTERLGDGTRCSSYLTTFGATPR